MGHNVLDILNKHGVEVEADTESLAHYGTKGMKWGERKSDRKSAKKAAGEKADSDRKAIKTMSDDDLKVKINRLKLEKEYRTLTAPKVNQGRKIVGEILKDVGKQQAKNYLNQSVEKALTAAALKAAAAAAAKAAIRAAV